MVEDVRGLAVELSTVFLNVPAGSTNCSERGKFRQQADLQARAHATDFLALLENLGTLTSLDTLLASQLPHLLP